MKKTIISKLKAIILIVGLTILVQSAYSQCACPPNATTHNVTWTPYPSAPDARTYIYSYTVCGNGRIIFNSLSVSVPGNSSPYIENSLSLVMQQIIRLEGDPGEICFPANCFRVINNKVVVVDGNTTLVSEYQWCDAGCCCVPTYTLFNGEYDSHNGEQCPGGSCQSLCF